MAIMSSEVKIMLSVDVYDANCQDKLKNFLTGLIKNQKLVILCVGSEKVGGDTLGPLVGSKLLNKIKGNVIVYGLMEGNITAKNLCFATNLIKTLHSDRLLMVVDAALGRESEIGTIQVYPHGLYPGSATNKNLPCVGDLSIVGVVNKKICAFELSMLYTAKQAMVSKMSEIISDCIAQCV